MLMQEDVSNKVPRLSILRLNQTLQEEAQKKKAIDVQSLLFPDAATFDDVLLYCFLCYLLLWSHFQQEMLAALLETLEKQGKQLSSELIGERIRCCNAIDDLILLQWPLFIGILGDEPQISFHLDLGRVHTLNSFSYGALLTLRLENIVENTVPRVQSLREEILLHKIHSEQILQRLNDLLYTLTVICSPQAIALDNLLPENISATIHACLEMLAPSPCARCAGRGCRLYNPVLHVLVVLSTALSSACQEAIHYLRSASTQLPEATRLIQSMSTLLDLCISSVELFPLSSEACADEQKLYEVFSQENSAESSETEQACAIAHAVVVDELILWNRPLLYQCILLAFPPDISIPLLEDDDSYATIIALLHQQEKIKPAIGYQTLALSLCHLEENERRWQECKQSLRLFTH